MSTFKRKKNHLEYKIPPLPHTRWRLRHLCIPTARGVCVCVCVYVCVPATWEPGFGGLSGGQGGGDGACAPTICMTRSPSLFLGPVFSFCEKAGAYPSTATLCTA